MMIQMNTKSNQLVLVTYIPHPDTEMTKMLVVTTGTLKMCKESSLISANVPTLLYIEIT